MAYCPGKHDNIELFSEKIKFFLIRVIKTAAVGLTPHWCRDGRGGDSFLSGNIRPALIRILKSFGRDGGGNM